MSWRCSTCGEQHDDIPLSFAADFPDNYARLSSDDRELRALISSDQCILDEKEYYIRGCLEIPLRDADGVFLWGLWANLWPEDFDLISDAWEMEGRESCVGPFKGRLANSISEYPFETVNVKLTVQVEPLGTRPLFFIDEPDHPLGVMQEQGITLDNAHELASKILHNSSRPARATSKPAVV